MSGVHVTAASAPADTTETGTAQFADLAAEASSLEGGPPVPGTPAAADAEAASIAAQSAELLQALTMARLIVAPMFAWWDQFPQVWGDATLRGIADGGAAVMARHGWTTGELFAKWGPYIALGMATAPPCMVTAQAIKARRQQLQSEAQQRAQKPAEGAAGDGSGKAPD